MPSPRRPSSWLVDEPAHVVADDLLEGRDVHVLIHDVGGFAECTGVDASGIRFGHSTIGASMGVVPMAIQVDGVTGPELVEILIGAMPAENVRLLRDGEHEGWSYRFTEGFAVTASPDTLYLMQQFCCVAT